MKGEETENKKIGCTVNLMVRGTGSSSCLPRRTSSVLPCGWLGLPAIRGWKPDTLSQDVIPTTGTLEPCAHRSHPLLGKT